ncbi:MAG: redoxin domain-containing protein [Acidobacteriota bacterium]|nr:redoxin domain-containing protein [Acidobacteriota bacterium]
MFRVKSLITSLLIFTLMAAAAIAQTETTTIQPDAVELLKKVEQNYADLKTYHLEGQSVMEMKGDGFFMRMEMPFAFAVGNPGQRLMRIKVFFMNLHQVSNGQTEWVYSPAEKQYTKKPFDKDSVDGAARFDMGKSEAMKMAMFSEEQMKDLKSARIVREEALEVSGQHINCYVIEAEFGLGETKGDVAKAMPSGKAPESVKMTFWVDKQRPVILQNVFDGGGTMAEFFKIFGDGADFKMTTKLSVAKINETLPDSLFVFAPPEDAKEVEQFESKLADLLKGGEEEPKRESLVGKDAMTFTLGDLNGKSFNLSKLRGKVVVIDFWASWCGPCRETMPHIEKLHKEFKDKGLVVLGINDEDIDDAKQFIQKNGYTFPTLVDVEGAVSQLYGITSIPQTLIIDRDGKIFAHFYGSGEEENLRAAVKIALETKETKAEAAKPAKRQVARSGARRR